MMDVQHALLAYTHKSNGPSWRAFGGNFISMVVPVTKEGESHKFQVKFCDTTALSPSQSVYSGGAIL